MTERKQTPDIPGPIPSGVTPPGHSPTPQPLTALPTMPAAPPPAARVERAPRVSTHKQTQWEYLIVSFHEQNGWHARFINGHELETYP